MIELAAVTKRYANQEVLAEIDLRIEPGTTTVIIGPSGCGKSTVLRLMVGLIAPDLGEVTFEGRSLSRATVMAVRHRTGYVIQDGGLFPHLTARENITLLAGVLGWPNTRVQRRLSRLADLTKFPVDGLDRLPVELSGGQRQRVALMRALMLDPDVLLLDEPLAALDPMIRFDLQTDLREIFRELAKTVVLVTHDLAEAAFLGDRIVLMRAGKIVQEGSLDQMLTRPADEFVSRFVNAQRRSL